MAKYIKFGNEGRKNILSGISLLAKTVAVTMGPMGKNVILGKTIGAPTITKDGVSVAREVVLDDPIEELGCQLVKEVAGRTADIAGDGTTTATVLAYEILKRGVALTDEKKYNPVHLRKGINWAVKEVTAILDKAALPIETDSQLRDIAIISANNDIKLGTAIADAYISAGKDGMVVAEAVPGVEDSVRMVEGIELSSGYLNQGFVEQGKGAVNLDDCRILICDREITHISDNLGLFNDLSAGNNSLLIICKDLKKEALQIFLKNNQLGRIKVCAIKLPNMGANNDAWLEDLAALTGTIIVGKNKGIPLSDLTIDRLGFASSVVVDKQMTKILSPKKDIGRVNASMASYKKSLNTLIGDLERRDIRMRMSFLTSRAAVITVGYSTELELREKGDRVDDAMSAVRAAIEEGYVAGGGFALLHASNVIDISKLDEKFRPGAQVIIESIKVPARQILLNAYEDPDDIISNIKVTQNLDFGYNCITETFGSMIGMGVIDPVKVTKTALNNSSSISLLLLTTEAVLVDIPDNPSGWQPPAGWRLPSSNNLNHKF